MFEKLMFWKKSEPDPSSFGTSGGLNGSFNTSLNPLDVQSPPAFDAAVGAQSQFSPNLSPNLGMSAGVDSFSPTNANPSFSSPSFATGMGGTDAFSGTTNPFQAAPASSGMALPSQAGFGMTGALPDRNAAADTAKIHPRDIELILSRLELVRAEIENVNHRLSFIEQSMQRPAGPSGKGKNWY